PDPVRERVGRALVNFMGDKNPKPLEALIRDKSFADLPPDAVLHLALALTLHRQVGLAVEALQQIQPRHPAAFWTNYYLGLRLIQAGRPAEALGYFRVGVARRPNNPGVRMNLANTLEFLGRSADAEAEYREAIRRQPDYAPVHFNLGIVLYHRG